MNIAFPHKSGKGGPGSFQLRFEKALKERDFNIVYAGDNQRADVIVVVGGTKRLFWLWKANRNNIPIIHRLDGLSWLHRKAGLKTFLFGEWGNFVFKFIHGFLASHIVYQSQFVKKWWKKSGWSQPDSSSVIYNGIDTQLFKCIYNPKEPVSLLCVEGTLDYSPFAIDLLNKLQTDLVEKTNIHSIILYGGFRDQSNKSKLHSAIDYRGKVTRSELPDIYKNAIYLSLDVNAACPNTVIEALACGLPIVGFDTGALKELVPESAGKIIPYGGDPWQLAFPDVEGLIESILEIHSEYESYSNNARDVAEKNYNMESMVTGYIDVINAVVKFEKG